MKRRSIDVAFETLRKAIAGARRYDDAALLGAMLTNYATASVQDGSVTDAITCLEEFEGLQSSAPSNFAGPLSYPRPKVRHTVAGGFEEPTGVALGQPEL
ncbi:MAG TPA: hypothetical protein VGK84_07695 [Candidatus Tumulicola sp.]